MEEQEKKWEWDRVKQTEKNEIEHELRKSINELERKIGDEKKEVSKQLVRNHSKELLDLEKRLEKVIQHAFDSKDEEVNTLRHQEEYHRLKLDELTEDIRRSQEWAEDMLHRLH